MPRLLIYSHDTYGLGHLRRNLLIAGRVAARSENTSVLLVTGSPRARAFSLPDGCDTLKMPSVIKQPEGGYRSRTLRMSLDDVRLVRSRLVVAAAETFQPDVILVDHAPAGMEGELSPLFARLQEMDGSRPGLVLGLRDVIDEAGRVREEWDRFDVWNLIASVYERVLVYGDPTLPTTAVELGLPGSYPDRITHVGYVAPDPAPSADWASSHDRKAPYVLVTAGGGGDGASLLGAYAEYLESEPGPLPFRSVVVTGPFLSPSRFQRLRARLTGTASPVEVIEFTEQIEPLTMGASAIVSMGGYNTAAEALRARVPSLFIPRSAPRLEQTIRCERLSKRSGIEWCAAPDVTPGLIARFLASAMSGRRLPAPDVDLGGLEKTAEILETLLLRHAARRERHARTA
jgi:predicted glycosyltransferase